MFSLFLNGFVIGFACGGLYISILLADTLASFLISHWSMSTLGNHCNYVIEFGSLLNLLDHDAYSWK